MAGTGKRACADGPETSQTACYRPFAMRERLGAMSSSSWREPVRRYGAPLAVGLVLGLLGPFGTFDALPLGPRLAYWLAVVSANWILCDAAIRRMERLLPAGLALRETAVPVAGALIASLPATGIVRLANDAASMDGGSLLDLYWKVLLLCVAIGLPFYLREVQAAAAPVQKEPEAPKPEPEIPAAPAGDGSLFFARLQRPPAGRLLCLEMQDHYLAVHAEGGSDLVLCRMEDAARELGGLGRRVHRSWWVAADAVAGVERDGARLRLRLSDGRAVPVGRTYRAELRDAGWLDKGAAAGVATGAVTET